MLLAFSSSFNRPVADSTPSIHARNRRETEDGKRRHRLKQEQDRASCSSKTAASFNTNPEIISSGLSSDSASKNTSSQYGEHGQGPRAKTDQSIESNDGGGGNIKEYVRDLVPLREDKPSVTDVDAFPTTNGGVCRNGLYAWSQSIHEARHIDSFRTALTYLCYDSENFNTDNQEQNTLQL